MLNLIREKLNPMPPVARQPLTGSDLREAAVLMALTDEASPQMVFIKRAEHVNSHSGQVAFPGGMWEAKDKSLLHTALRESEEEVALPASVVDVFAALEVRETRFNIRVSPYVGVIPGGLSFKPEPAEVEAVFQVPVAYLADIGNLTSTVYVMKSRPYEVPCFFYEGFCIWGFTLHLLADFLKQTLEVSIPLQYRDLDGNIRQP